MIFMNLNSTCWQWEDTILHDERRSSSSPALLKASLQSCFHFYFLLIETAHSLDIQTWPIFYSPPLCQWWQMSNWQSSAQVPPQDIIPWTTEVHINSMQTNFWNEWQLTRKRRQQNTCCEYSCCETICTARASGGTDDVGFLLPLL